MADNTIHRRRFPRRIFDHPAGVLNRGIFTVCEGFEISEGGMLTNQMENCVQGSIVVINFFIPNRDFVTVRGEVVYIKPANPQQRGMPAMGIKFQNLQFREKRFIRDFIADKTQVEVGFD